MRRVPPESIQEAVASRSVLREFLRSRRPLLPPAISRKKAACWGRPRGASTTPVRQSFLEKPSPESNDLAAGGGRLEAGARPNQL